VRERVGLWLAGKGYFRFGERESLFEKVTFAEAWVNKEVSYGTSSLPYLHIGFRRSGSYMIVIVYFLNVL